MSTSQTITTTTTASPIAGPSTARPARPPPASPAALEDNDQTEDEIMRRALEKVRRLKDVI
ncbi:hypothetical protein EV359DRAFT_86657, partial [Lentinula novae-zelandiae]